MLKFAFVLKTLLALIFGLLLMALQPAFSQTTPGLDEKISAGIAPLSKRLEEAETVINSEAPTEAVLTKQRTILENIKDEALVRTVKFLPEVSDLLATLNRLPAPPAEGDPEEPEEITKERQELSDEKAKVILAIKDAELLTVRANTLIARILEVRRSAFISDLLQQRRIGLETFNIVREQAGQEFGNIASGFGTWIRTIFQFRTGTTAAVLLLLVFVAGLMRVVTLPVRRWLDARLQQDEVTYLSLVLNGFLSVVVPALILSILAFSLHHLLAYAGLYRFRIDLAVPALLKVLVGFVFVALVLRSLHRPRDPKWRILNETDTAAKSLFGLGLLIAGFYAVDILMGQLFIIFGTPVEFTIIKSLLTTLLIAFALIVVTRVRLIPKKSVGIQSGYRGWNPVTYWSLWALILGLLLSALAGYVSLGRFIAGQFVVTGSVLATAYLGFLTSKAIAEAGALTSTRIGKYLMKRRGFSTLRLDQMGLLGSIILNIAIVFSTVPFIALQWGYKRDEIFSWFKSLLTGFNVAGYEFSIGRVVGAMLVFLVLILITRAIQGWFDSKVLSRTRFDNGVKNSMRSGLGYVGFFFAGLIGLSWAGLNLSNIALIAGALSVGIGFGLQNIVGNFVSGIILLVERPVKVGDIIQVGSAEGYVRKINVRATELETFDRLSVIIPNSEVINTAVGNWMHKDHNRRIVIAVGVAYGSDTELVRETLMEIGESNPCVSKKSPPFVYFSNFGASSLDFQLRVIIEDINDFLEVENDLRFKVAKVFAERGIEIAFPQQDIHIRSGLTALNKVNSVEVAPQAVAKPASSKSSATRKTRTPRSKS